MNHDQSSNSIQQAVLDKVRAGMVRRRPRSLFVLRIAATITVGIFLLTVSALVTSFIIFSIHESGEQFLLGFGWRGIIVFFTLFPWFCALLSFGLLVLLEWLLQGFKFGYRIPLLNIFFAILGISVVLGVLINFTPLHSMLLSSAKQGQLPVFGPNYEHILDHHEDQGVCRGQVVSVNGDTFVVQHDDHDADHDDGTYVVQLATSTRDGSLDPNLHVPHVGDEVLVFGEPGPGFIVAEHIQVLPPHQTP